MNLGRTLYDLPGWFQEVSDRICGMRFLIGACIFCFSLLTAAAASAAGDLNAEIAAHLGWSDSTMHVKVNPMDGIPGCKIYEVTSPRNNQSCASLRCQIEGWNAYREISHPPEGSGAA
jgi:hypothetical protein